MRSAISVAELVIYERTVEIVNLIIEIGKEKGKAKATSLTGEEGQVGVVVNQLTLSVAGIIV